MNEDIFRGAFVMRSHDHQILTSTYFNKDEEKPQPETAKRTSAVESDKDLFPGTFKVIWLENNESRDGELIITRESNSPVYKLTWSIEGKNKYKGQAIREASILFGYYWKCDNQ